MTGEYDRIIAVGITLGDGVDFVITRDDNLCVYRREDKHGGSIINLGRCTRKRIRELQDYLGRLAIHAVD